VTSRTARRARVVATAALAAIAVGALGALATDLGPWYVALRKPPWQPPYWLFGPAWTLIFGLASLAGCLAWFPADAKGRRWIVALFAVNAALNFLWSWLFFRLHRPDLALAEVGFLWLSIAVLIAALWRHSRLAAWLLVPYLAGVTFAAVLNRAIVGLN